MANFRGQIEARLGLNDKPFRQSLDRSQKRLKGFGDKLGPLGKKLAGVFAVGAIAGFSESTIRAAERVGDLAERVDVTAESLQTLKFIAEGTGASQEALTRALRNVQTRAQEAADGNKRYSESLQTLGIDTQKFIELKPEEQFELVAKAITQAQNSTEAFTAASNILGRESAPQLRQALVELGEKGFAQVRKEAQETGEFFSNEGVKEAQEFGTAFDRLKGRLASNFLPVLTSIVKGVQSLIDIFKAAKAPILAIIEPFKQIGETIGELISLSIEPLRLSFLSAVNAAKSFAQALTLDFDGAAESFNKSLRQSNEAVNKFIENTQQVPSVIKKNYDQAAQNLREFATEFFGDTFELIGKLKETWGEAAKDTGEKAKEASEKALQETVESLEKQTTKAKEEADKLNKALDILEQGEKKREFESLSAEQQLVKLKEDADEIREKALNKEMDIVETAKRLNENLSQQRSLQYQLVDKTEERKKREQELQDLKEREQRILDSVNDRQLRAQEQIKANNREINEIRSRQSDTVEKEVANQEAINEKLRENIRLQQERKDAITSKEQDLIEEFKKQTEGKSKYEVLQNDAFSEEQRDFAKTFRFRREKRDGESSAEALIRLKVEEIAAQAEKARQNVESLSTEAGKEGGQKEQDKTNLKSQDDGGEKQISDNQKFINELNKGVQDNATKVQELSGTIKELNSKLGGS